MLGRVSKAASRISVISAPYTTTHTPPFARMPVVREPRFAVFRLARTASNFQGLYMYLVRRDRSDQIQIRATGVTLTQDGMGRPAKKPVVVGIGPDKLAYSVKQFGKTTKQGAKYNISIQRRRVKVHTTTTTTTTTTTSTIRTPLFLSASMPPLGRKDRDHHQRWRKQSSDPHHPPCGV